MEQESKSKLSKWLDNLQQESWQLELVVSGFAIFLLLATFEPFYYLKDKIRYLGENSRTFQLLMLPYGIVLGAWFALAVNLIAHVLLRGLWISTVGLRSVSHDIDFDYLNLRPKFDRFLRRRIGSFDRYIEKLENYCSVIFAFTFLIIFMLISMGMFLGFIGLMDMVVLDWVEDKWPNFADRVEDEIMAIIFIGAVIYFIDFLTLGWLKRRKWFARAYYPIYRFYSLLTLAFLYRPIYYNLIDNKFGRKISLLLLPYILVGLIISSINIVTHKYIPDEPGNLKLSKSTYDDERPEHTFITTASIPSKYVGNGFLELYLPYNPNTDDNTIAQLCPDLEPGKFTGVKLRGAIGAGQIRNNKANRDSLLHCISQMHHIFVNDSLFADTEFRYYDHPVRQDKGLLTILDVDYLERGAHTLRVETQFYSSRRDTLYWNESAFIPFWKE